MLGRRGQVGTEYMVIIAVLLLSSGIMAAYALVNYNESIKISQLSQATSEIEAAIEQVYVAGPGNVLIVKIELPIGLQSVNITGSEAVYTITLLGGNTQFSISGSPDLFGSLPTSEGIHYIRVESTSSGVTLSEV